MNKKIQIILLFLTITISILSAVPESFAGPQYLTNLTAVYGDGSCGTCHVIASGGGPRDSNGTIGQHNSNGSFRQYNNTNRTFSRSGNRTSRQGNSNRTLPLNSYGMLFEKQPDHIADAGSALAAIGQPPAATVTVTTIPAETATTEVTSMTAAGSQAASGFGIVLSLTGLVAWSILARRHEK